MNDPQQNLRRLRAALQGGVPVPLDVADWLLTGLDRAGGGEDLGTALGLVPAGRSARRAAATSVLWQLFCRQSPSSPWPRCERMAALFLDYYRTGYAPDDDVLAMLRRLFALEHPPMSTRAIYRRLWRS
ncbi:hypothetical protein TspCOW1_07370 [Thiohalobacter sp. COW1]|nr:hypothetical protein TspCOW1_07370 [Thiohalobacter sp. COW1]